MPSMLNEALEWLDRAEQAREVAGSRLIPARGERSWSLPKASIGSPEPPLPQQCSGDGSWRRKTRNETADFSRAFLVKQQAGLWRSKRTSQHRGLLTPEERARITDLQDLLIARFVEHREAVAERQEERVKTIEAEIDSLLREKEEIEKWAAVGSA
jgi:hypothetical protein